MTPLTKEQILDASDLPRQAVEVPEWGGSIYVRVMTGSERDAYESSLLEWKLDRHVARKELTNARARLAALTICDETGKRLFDESEVEALGAKSGAALTRVVTAAQGLNAMAERDVSDLEGNSQAAPGDASASG